MEKTLTIIPAKMGSLRLPKKNIRKLADKALINYTIEAALASGVCGEIMVSTESEETAEIAIAAGAKVPFIRPDYLSKDPYGVVDVCINVLKTYEKNGSRFKKLIILLPTSPFRTKNDIRSANKIFDICDAKFLMSVSEFDHNPFGALRTDNENKNQMIACFPEYIGKKQNEVPKCYRANGAVCIVDVNAFLEAGTYYGKPLHTYTMPWQRSIDIDNEIDFRFAEFLIKNGITSNDE
jgi:N-acylneuraminate cytidylyltransferase/CMP-N,N'-diacetyllegionaminic acid synthase